MPYDHVYAPESKAALSAYIERADEEGQLSYESKHVRKGGGVFPVLMTVKSVKDETGKVQYRVVFCQDISKMKEAEASLAEKSKLLEAFFTSTVTPLVFLERNFNFVRVNEAYAKSCSLDVSDFKGHNHFELYPHEENEAIFRQVVETKVPHQAIAKPFSFPDHPEWGTTYWNWTLTPLLDDKGEVEFLVFSLEDVTGRAQAQEAAREASLYARSLIEASLDPLVTISRAGKIMDVNKATELVTGVSPEILIGSDFLNYFTEPEKARKGYQQVFQNGFVKDYPLSIRHTSGRVTEVLYNATLYRNEAGEIQGVFAAARDVTEHKEIESRIYATNALLGLFSKRETRKEYLDETVHLVQSWTGCCCVGIRALDKKGFIPYESFVGFSREFWESENWLSVDQHQCACIRVITRKPDPQDASVMSPAGSFVCNNTVDFIEKLPQEEKSRFRGVCVLNGFLSVAVFPISYQNKVLGALHLADEKEGMVRPKTVEFIESMAPMIGEAINRFNLEDELRESEVRLRHLSSELITVQENERKRIALEIHDSLGQSLNAIKFKVSSAMQDLLNHKAKTGMKHFQDLVPIVQEGIEEARRLQMDLRPPILDDLGISATISWFCRQFQKTYANIQIEPLIDIDEEVAPKSLKIVIYRILQEAMNNIAKHSGASLVSLSLTQEENRVALTIQDNGQGFDLSERLNRAGSQRGLGLTSMRERADLSGGTFTIESVKDKGTTIQISWPV
jgi:PAS domain S-box-containing protein